MSTLRDLYNLSLLDKLTDSSTSTGTVHLQTVHNGVDSDQLHLDINKIEIKKTLGTSARSLS